MSVFVLVGFISLCCCAIEISSAEDAHKISKRFSWKSRDNKWEKGIIPYVFHRRVGPFERNDIKIAQSMYEKYTCIRFVPYVRHKSKYKYGINHEGHLIFLSDRYGRCYTQARNYRNQWGRSISCCMRNSCMHELGHAMGLIHEHQSPLRNDWIRVNWNNIRKRFWKWYKKIDPDDVNLYKYDILSAMHYDRKSFHKKYQATMTVLYHDLHIGQSFYYMLHDVAKTHDCQRKFCPNFKMECVNDGFATQVRGVCSCMCPDGLDPSTGCATVMKEAHHVASWPGGSYGLLATTSGCPKGFKTGSYQTWSNDISVNSLHYHLTSVFRDLYTKYYFCVAENSKSETKWPRGAYCLHRKFGSCPAGFEQGRATVIDKVGTKLLSKTFNGSLPDGNFKIDTEFFFCCKNDGFDHEPMDMPNKEPFALLRYKHSYKRCQAVRGMYGTGEYYSVGSLNNGTRRMSGILPYIQDFFVKTVVHYCYYRPYKKDCGGVIDLTNDNPSEIFTSPNYPNDYTEDLECYWLIKAPVNITIVLNFDDFHIENQGGKCKDSVEIRHVNIGQPGKEYCGDIMRNTIRSLRNLMMVRLHTNYIGSRKGFKATATALFPEDMCYNLADKGASYRGKVAITRSMKKCLPWTDSSCPHHVFNPRDFTKGLEKNYCRNPDNTAQPWCYTDYTDCDREYCDVCLVEKLNDAYSCKNRGKMYCTSVLNAFSRCPKACKKYFLEENPILKASEIHCGVPKLSDADFLSNKKIFNVGDKVDLLCRVHNTYVTAMCLTSGKWSVGRYVCGVCSDGWARFDGRCYKYFNQKAKYYQAKEICEKYGAMMAPIHNYETLNFVISLRTHLWTIWLGAIERFSEGQWMWLDGTEMSYSRWASGQPNRNYKGRYRDCGIIWGEDRGSYWEDEKCRAKYRFVCSKKIPLPATCDDRILECEEHRKSRSDMCNFREFAQQECRLSCGICTKQPNKCFNIANNQAIYYGVQSKTSSGLKCQRWDQQKPHSHRHTNPDDFPDVTLHKAENFCRDPNSLGYPWCYTTDPNIRAESCGILPCDEPSECYNVDSGGGSVYTGHKATTASGIPCTNWTIDYVVWPRLNKTYFPDASIAEAANYCRDPTGLGFPWCHTGYRGKHWKSCGIPPCAAPAMSESDCFTFDINNRVLYSGTRRKTQTGVRCQNWVDQMPHRHSTKYAAGFPDESVSAAENFCRDPDGKGEPWCYTTNPNIRWQSCGIPTCTEPNNYVELIYRYIDSSMYYVISGNTSNLKIEREGEIRAWHFYSRYGGSVALSIWRLRPDLEKLSYEFIGQNRIKLLKRRVHRSEIPLGQRIPVQKNDLIGVFFEDEASIPYSYNDCYNGTKNMYSIKEFKTADVFTPGKILKFRLSNIRYCVTYSLRAIIGQVPPPRQQFQGN